MEYGSLAEWVESIAEVLAVSVALFLPYFQERRKNKAKNQRAKQVVLQTVRGLMHQENIQSSNVLIELKGFVEIYSMLATNEKIMDILAFGSAALQVIDKNDSLNDQQQAQLQTIIDGLEKSPV